MGLDMYLSKKTYIWSGTKGEIKLFREEKEIPINLERVSYITEEVLYWRKANYIHKWFVDKVQEGNDDCKSYYVSKSDLEELLDICKQIKENCPLVEGKIVVGQSLKDGEWVDIIEDGKVMQNQEFAESLLPCESGFFFGSTNYDEFYMDNIEKTITELTKILEEENKLNENGFFSDFEYSSSW